METTKALPRRMCPSALLTLMLRDANSASPLKVELRLCFDFNACAEIEQRTGFLVMGGKNRSVWDHLGEASVLRAMLWAAALAYQPDYADDAGITLIGSYLDASNAISAGEALNEAFIVSLSPEKQKEIREAAERAKRKAEGAGSDPLPMTTEEPDATPKSISA